MTNITSIDKLLTTTNVVFVMINVVLSIVVVTGIKLFKDLNVKYRDLKKANDFDKITNIRNEDSFQIEAEKVLNEKDKKYALAHFDIDKFTVINNNFGYEVGDEILRNIGKLLNNILKSEICGKADADNFLVLFKYKNDKNEILKKISNISSSIESLEIWKKYHIKPVITTGIYFIEEDDKNIRLAIDKAKVAKLDIKGSYSSGYALYNENINHSFIEERSIEYDMHEALENEDFKIYIQPKINLKDGCISGAEALVRWENKKLGFMSPKRFIPIFEKNGFIINLDKFVFENVCKSMRNWLDLGYKVVPVSVNVSRVDFLNSSFVTDYKEILEKYHIPENLIEIEITESVVFGNADEVFSIMRDFRNSGFKISMDDFGSGYSSLGLLGEMPINTLKLDKTFLNNIEDYNTQVIVSNIVNLAKNLELNVVSEGVETNLQADFLKDIGCDMAQGFIFSKPMPIEEYGNLISKNNKSYFS